MKTKKIIISKETKKILRLNKYYSSMNFNTFLKKNSILFTLIFCVPLITFIVVLIVLIGLKQYIILVSVITGVLTYFGSIILSIYVFYENWTIRKNIKNKEEEINIYITKSDFRRKYKKLLYEITPEENYSDKYRCSYNLFDEYLNMEKPIYYFGFGISIQNLDYINITDLKLIDAYYSNSKVKDHKFLGIFGKYVLANTIIKFKEGIKDFIHFDKDLGIKEDDESKILLIYLIKRENIEYRLLYEITFCSVGMKETKYIIEVQKFNFIEKKMKSQNIYRNLIDASRYIDQYPHF